MKLLNIFRREKSIYTKILETNFNVEELKKLNIGLGEYELEIIRGTSIKKITTREINKAVDDYYKDDKKALSEFSEFFKNNRAIEAESPFLNYLLQKIEFNEDKLIGLSILLMRDSLNVESVKFGMLLTKYYNLRSVPRAYDIFFNLCKHPEFIYYGIDVLKNIDYGILDDLYVKMFGCGKNIIEESW